MPRGRAVLAEVMALASNDEPGRALALANRAEAAMNEDPAALIHVSAARAIARFTAADYDAAVLAAERALLLSEDAGHDGTARAVALAARLIAGTGTPWAAAGPEAEQRLADELWSRREDALGASGDPLTALLLSEALFSTGRVALAAGALDERFGDHDWAREPLPGVVDGFVLPSLPFLPLRVLFYAGRTAEAEALLDPVVDQARRLGHGTWIVLGDGLRALLAGSRGNRAAVRLAQRRTARALPRPRGYLQASARALVGFGLAAIDDLEAAAAEIRAAGGPGLRRLQTADRALGFEVLVRAALAVGDRTAADRWARQLLPLTAQHPAAEIAERVFAVLDLARGENGTALRRTDAALARAELGGVLRESAQHELVLARALAAAGRGGEATALLQRVATTTEARGDLAARRQAARQLRSLGRRVLPVPGSGWAGLSAGERDIAGLAAEGYDNRAIGAALFHSPRTVQGAITRILIAFGVRSRAALPAAVAASGHPPARAAAARPAPLTARQTQVAALLAEGRSNAEIAQRLGIARKTVEQHVAAICLRWEVRSRAAVAALVLHRTDPG